MVLVYQKHHLSATEATTRVTDYRLGNAGEDLTELDNYLSSSSFFAKKSLTKMT